VLIGGILAAMACSSVVGPDDRGAPTLRSISAGAVSEANLRQIDVFGISASPLDTSFRLSEKHRLEVQIEVSSGDREVAVLHRLYCPQRERGYGYLCSQFTIYMKEGHRVADIADRIASIGGRYHGRALAGEIAFVTMPFPDVAETARRATRWPGVAVAQVSVSACHPDAYLCGHRSHLRKLVPMTLDDPIPGDGIVQVRRGDVVTVTYQQPGGGTIESSVTVQ
jgi:hypothetical protein